MIGGLGHQMIGRDTQLVGEPLRTFRVSFTLFRPKLLGLPLVKRQSAAIATHRQLSMLLTPTIAIHMSAALAAVALGPIALWARKGTKQRPMIHRASGYAWVTLMLITAISALFIRDLKLPNLAGYTPIHLLVPYTLFGLFGAFVYLARKDIAAHRKTMQSLYFGACLGAGAFTLLPGRLLGNLVLGQWLGLL
jgi:uncharacterized membrane protein